MPIRIPRTAISRRERTYAQLIHRVATRPKLPVFAGRVFFRTGTLVDVEQLRPAPDYPEVPLLHEFAGSDRTGRGHNRSNYVHVLWRFDAKRGEFEEIARALSQGPEWFAHLAPIAQREISRPAEQPANQQTEVAHAATARILALLDSELEFLADDGRERLVTLLYDQFTARFVSDDVVCAF